MKKCEELNGKRRLKFVVQRWTRKRKGLLVQKVPISRVESRVKEIVHYVKIKSDQKTTKLYGFISDTFLPAWDNVKNIVNNIQTHTYFNCLTTNSYHSLYIKLLPPDLIGELLGLELKCYIQLHIPKPESIKESIDIFSRDIRLKYSLSGREKNEFETYNINCISNPIGCHRIPLQMSRIE